MTVKEKAAAKAREYQVNDVCRVWNNGCPNVYYASMEMYEWTKKEMIDKACEWLSDNCDLYEQVGYEDSHCVLQRVNNNVIEDFKKAMEE